MKLTSKLKEHLHKYKALQVYLAEEAKKGGGVQNLNVQQVAALSEDELTNWATVIAKKEMVMQDVNYISPVICELYTMYMLHEGEKEPLSEQDMTLAQKISKAYGKRNFAVSGLDVVSLHTELEQEGMQDAIKSRLYPKFEKIREQLVGDNL